MADQQSTDIRMDAISETRLADVHPELRRRIRATGVVMAQRGAPIRVTQALRTWPQQAALFAVGRKTPGASCVHNGIARRVGTCPEHPWGLTVTKAPPGYTWHNFGLAVDAAPDDTSLPGWQPDWNLAHPCWRDLLAVAASFQLAEGATWRTYPDSPHFYPEEIPKSPDDLVRSVFADGGIRAVWDLYPSLSMVA